MSKLYFRNQTASPTPTAGEKSSTLPAGTGTGNSGTGFEDLYMGLVAGTAQVGKQINSLAQTGQQSQYVFRCSSDKIAAQTFSSGVTYTIAVAGQEGNGAANAFLRVSVYVWRPGNNSVVGYLYDGTADLGAEFNSPAEQGIVATFNTANNVTSQAGDILVCEVWIVATQSMGTSYLNEIWLEGATDPTNGGATSDAASYLNTGTHTISWDVIEAAVAESNAVTSTESADKTTLSAVAESVAATDAPDATGNYSAAVAESHAITDTIPVSGIYPRAVAESVAATDAPSASKATQASAAETVATGDTYTPSGIYNPAVAEAMAAAESLDGLVIQAGTVPLKLKNGWFANFNEADADVIAMRYGGLGATTPAAARANLGLVIGADVQAFDATLQSIANLTPGADTYIYFTGADTATTGAITAFGRSLVDDADAATALGTLGAQPADADLTALAALAGTGIAVRTASDTWAQRSIAVADTARLTVSNGSGAAGNPTLDLATLADGGTGSFLKFTRDSYGRVSGSTAVVQGDISGLVDSRYVRLDANTALNNGVLISYNSGTVSFGVNDLVPKRYVDALAQSLDIHASVRVATTGALTTHGTSPSYSATGGASGRGQITWGTGPTTIDGVSLSNGNRILVKDEGSGTHASNGVWVRTAQNTWDRATDWDEDTDVTAGAFTFVTEGTANGDSGWVVTTNDPIVVGGAGGTAITLVQFSGAGQITAGDGLTKTGNTLNVVTASSARIVVAADSIDLATVLSAGGPTGSASVVPIITWDAYGRLTAVSSASIAIAGSAVSGAYTASGLTMSTARLLGRTTASSGAAEEISVAARLSLATQTLDLATLSDGGGGSFLKFSRDTYGRVSGTSAVVLADINTLTGTGSLEIGHATDTTLARAAAGRLTVEGVALMRGPGSAVDNAVVRFDGTTGDLVQGNAAVTIDDNGDIVITKGTPRVYFMGTGSSIKSYRMQTDLAVAGDFGIYNHTDSQVVYRYDPSAEYQRFRGNLDISHIVQGQYDISRPRLLWSAGGTTTGYVIIKLPGSSSDNAMYHIEVDVYEYDSNNATTYFIGGHTSVGQWYNYGCRRVGSGPKSVRLGVKDGQYCIVLGAAGSSWSYGIVHLRKITNGIYASANLQATNYSIAQTNAAESWTWISGDISLNPDLTSTNSGQNTKVQGKDGSGAQGISLYDSGGTWRLQLYGDGSNQGFLNANWAGWDLRKINNGNLVITVSGTEYAVVRKNSSGYIYSDSWISFEGGAQGMYWPNHSITGMSTNPYLYPNSAYTYGSFVVEGIKNGYAGIALTGTVGPATLMFDGSGNGGLYDYQDWHLYWLRSDRCLGLGGSSTSSAFKAMVNGHLGFVAGGYVYPGRSDGGVNTGWFLYSNGTYGLQTNTSFNSGGLYDNGNRVYSASTYGAPNTGAVASTIAYRDSNGDLSTRYFLGSYINTTDDTSSGGSLTYLMGKCGDNYHRSVTADNVKTWMGFFTSSEITLSGTTMTAAHGLGAKPRFMRAVLVNQTGELGYSAGDEVAIDQYSISGQVSTISADATNCRWSSITGSTVIPYKDGSTYAAITTGNWKVKFYAIK